MITHWTVIGFYLDTREAYVEHVTGEDLTAKMADDMAHEILPEREDAITIAVFRGHHDDEWEGLGMPTTHEYDDDAYGCGHPEHNAQHPYQETVEAHKPGEPVNLSAVNTQLLTALEGLNPNIKGREASGEAYWHPIHVHPFHSFTAECPWCLRAAAVKEAWRRNV